MKPVLRCTRSNTAIVVMPTRVHMFAVCRVHHLGLPIPGSVFLSQHQIHKYTVYFARMTATTANLVRSQPPKFDRSVADKPPQQLQAPDNNLTPCTIHHVVQCRNMSPRGGDNSCIVPTAWHPISATTHNPIAHKEVSPIKEATHSSSPCCNSPPANRVAAQHCRQPCTLSAQPGLADRWCGASCILGGCDPIGHGACTATLHETPQMLCTGVSAHGDCPRVTCCSSGGRGA